MELKKEFDSKIKILIADDEPSITNSLAYALNREHYLVACAYDGKETLDKIESFKPDILILDVMMPEYDGYEVCKKINTDEKIGILMLTAKNNLMDKITGLELGADDYITKPFDLLELIARIRSLERRLKKSFAQKNIVKKEKENKKYEKGILIKSLERLIYIDGKEIELKPKELDLLIFLVKNNPYVLTREQILTNVWGMDYLGSSRTIDIHIQRLRKKLKNYSTCIQTVPCVGYKIKEFRGNLI